MTLQFRESLDLRCIDRVRRRSFSGAQVLPREPPPSFWVSFCSSKKRAIAAEATASNATNCLCSPCFRKAGSSTRTIKHVQIGLFWVATAWLAAGLFIGPLVSEQEPKGQRGAYRRQFPEWLDRAPFCLPTENTVLRRSFDDWFDARGIRPTILAEFEYSALMESFGRQGHALMSIPTVVEDDVNLQYKLKAVGRIDAIWEEFFAISAERRIKHPGVLAVSAESRKLLAK